MNAHLLRTIYATILILTLCVGLQAQKSPNYPNYSYPHRTTSLGINFADSTFSGAIAHYDTQADIVILNAGDPEYYGDSVTLKSFYTNFYVNAYGLLSLSKFAFIPYEPGFAFRVDGYNGGVKWSYDTPIGTNFTDSWIVGGTDNGKLDGQPILDVLVDSNGKVNAGGRFDLNITLPGNWSQFGKADNQTEVVSFNLGWTLDKNFTFDGQNTNFVAHAFGANGPLNLHFILHGSASKPLTITSLDHRTFITLDLIALQATVAGATPNVPVRWTVHGRDAALGITDFPKDEVHLSDANGISTFSFSPSKNPSLVKNRVDLWTKGSKAANETIRFEVTATITVNDKDYIAKLSETKLGPLSQDDTDLLRQEYVDYASAYGEAIYGLPKPTIVVGTISSTTNQGNYAKQLSVDIPSYQERIQAIYQKMTVMYNGKPVPLKNALVRINSAFRCPQRNRAVKGAVAPGVPTIHSAGPSQHIFGRAMDLSPFPVMIARNQFVPCTILYPALLAAAQEVGEKAYVEFSGEEGTRQNDSEASNPLVNQVHVQW